MGDRVAGRTSEGVEVGLRSVIGHLLVGGWWRDLSGDQPTECPQGPLPLLLGERLPDRGRPLGYANRWARGGALGRFRSDMVDLLC